MESEAVLGSSLPANEARALDSHLTGRPVLTASGERLGEIAGFQVNVATGKIPAFELRPDTSFLGRLAAFGRERVIEVPDASVVSLGAKPSDGVAERRRVGE